MPYPVAATRGKNFGTPAIAGWWLSGSIPSANCLLAYRAKGAADLATSYTNLANPGTYTLAPGVAPTFNTATGWTFDGSTQWLSIAAAVGPTTPKPLSILARVTVTNTAGNKGLISGSNINSLNVRFSSAEKVVVLLQNNAVGAGGTTVVSGDKVIGFTYDGSGNHIFYLNAVSDGTGTEDLTPSGDIEAIGKDVTTISYNGVVAALSLYNIVLTPTQVTAVTTAMLAL